MKRYIKPIALILFLIFGFKQTYSQRQSVVDSLTNLIIKEESDSVKVDLYNELSKELLFSSRDTSEIYAKHALSSSLAINYKKGIADSYVSYANISNVDGNFDLAIGYILKAIELYQANNDTSNLIVSYSTLGLTYYYLDNSTKSYEYNKLALDLSKKVKKKNLNNIYNNLGLSFMKMEQNDSALFYFEKSVIISNELNDKTGVIYSYGNIANIYFYQNNVEKALEMYKKVAEVSIEIDDKNSLALSHINMAILYNEMAEKPENLPKNAKYFLLASKHAEKALFHSTELNSLKNMNYSYFELIKSYKGLQNYKKAFEYAEKYIDTSDSIFSIDKIKEAETLEKRFKTEQQKLKIESMTKEKELNEAIIKKQDQFIILGILAFIIILILLVFVFILYRKKKNANILLNEKNEAIKDQRTEIATQRDNLSELAFELKKSNKTKDKYFSVFAHDLKNPFQSILGFSELLLEQSKEGDYSNIEKYAEYIYETTKKTFTLLENLLNWGRVQRGLIKYLPNYYHLHDLLQECVEINEEPAKSKEVSIISEIPEDLIIYADKYMFTTIIRNLITNSIKFTERGGKITLSAQKTQNDFVEITVKDTGIGIKKENISKIFKLDHSGSVTGTENEKGTGLGLLVCKEFAEKNKGELKVESTVGEGSSFILLIPANNNKS